jgi:hypothetical protein
MTNETSSMKGQTYADEAAARSGEEFEGMFDVEEGLERKAGRRIDFPGLSGPGGAFERGNFEVVALKS